MYKQINTLIDRHVVRTIARSLDSSIARSVHIYNTYIYNIYTDIHIYICVYIYNAQIYIYIHIHVCIYIYMYIHIYTQTHIYGAASPCR